MAGDVFFLVGIRGIAKRLTRNLKLRNRLVDPVICIGADGFKLIIVDVSVMRRARNPGTFLRDLYGFVFRGQLIGLGR